MPVPDYVSQSQLAEILQITRQQVWRLTVDGKLHAFDGAYFLPLSIQEYILSKEMEILRRHLGGGAAED